MIAMASRSGTPARTRSRRPRRRRSGTSRSPRPWRTRRRAPRRTGNPEGAFPVDHPDGAFFTVVAGPVSILRESTELVSEAVLTLGAREQSLDLLEEARKGLLKLRVFRKDPASGRGVAVSVREFRFTGPSAGSGVAFPIERFGSYLAVVERRRD